MISQKAAGWENMKNQLDTVHLPSSITGGAGSITAFF
jgi:hypothetical protein